MNTKKFKAIIIDDEYAAREIVELELKELAPDIEVVVSCDSYDEALKQLTAIDVDIAFIDIILPRGNGLDLLRNIPNRNFYPVIISSHVEYAIEAIKEEAFDYILKPFETKELNRTLTRFRKNVAEKKTMIKVASNTSEVFEARDHNSSVFIQQKNLIYLEADGSYTKIYYGNQNFVMSKNLKQLSTLLNEKIFYRCSNKCVVNIQEIEKIEHNNNLAILKDGTSLQVSIRRKDGLLKMLREAEF